MRVFVTGATGFIGSAVVPELLSAGHQVLGLARSEASGKALTAAGAEVHVGSLDDVESLKAGAAKSDAVVHLAFIHDFSNYAGAVQTDLRAIEAMGSVLEGTNKPLAIAGGMAGIAQGRASLESDPAGSHSPRGRAEALTLGMAAKGVRSILVRLPPTVHGEGDHGFVPMLIDIARAKGVAAHVGDGSNRWPAVHRSDAARLFRLAIEKAPPGTRVHAVHEEGVPTREIAGVIGKRLRLPVVSKTTDEAAAHFGFLAMFFGADVPASSKATRELLGWSTTGPALIEDLDNDYYFAAKGGAALM